LTGKRAFLVALLDAAPRLLKEISKIINQIKIKSQTTTLTAIR
jgi:hypothetical protein